MGNPEIFQEGMPQTLEGLKEELKSNEGVTPELIKRLGSKEEQKEVEKYAELLHEQSAPLLGEIFSNVLEPVIKKPDGKSFVELLRHCIDPEKTKKPSKIPLKNVLSSVIELTTFYPKKAAMVLMQKLSETVGKIDPKLAARILNSPDILLEKLRQFYK